MNCSRIEAALNAAWEYTWASEAGCDLATYRRRKPDVIKNLEGALTAALAAADAAAWRPIETAPKDGTHILVPMKFIGADVVAFDLGAWRETTSMLRLKDEPTHWQPLPAPPASIAELGGVEE